MTRNAITLLGKVCSKYLITWQKMEERIGMAYSNCTVATVHIGKARK